MSRGGGNRANPAPRCQSWHGRVRGGDRRAEAGHLRDWPPPPPPLRFLASDSLYDLLWDGAGGKIQGKQQDSCGEEAEPHPTPPSRGSCGRRGPDSLWPGTLW